MFKRLQDRWKVSGWRLFLVLVTFALGGSLTGIVGKKLMSLLNISSPFLYAPVYIIMITAIWPFMVMLVSLPLGQFNFFRNYIGRLAKKIWRR